MKMVLICMAVAIPAAFGAFYYGRSVGSHQSAMEIHEAENHGEREHAEHDVTAGRHETHLWRSRTFPPPVSI